MFFPLLAPISAQRPFRLQQAEEASLSDFGDLSTPGGWENLLEAAQKGDSPSYHAFLHAILPFCRAIARRHLAKDELVEDAVQESLLTLHRVRHTYQPGRPVRPWLTAIVTRRAIDLARQRSRIAGRELHDPIAYETFADAGAKQGRRAEDRDSLSQLLGELTPKQKEAIELVKLREMSLAEASEASGQTVASLKVNVHRGLRRLRLRNRDRGDE